MRARTTAHALPRRKKPSLAARVRPFWVIAVLLAALAGWGVAWLAHSPWFVLARLTVDVPLASPVSAGDVRRAAAIAPDANVWLVNTRAIASRVEAIPYVDRASIHRGQFPKPFVDLAITVRRPSGCVRASGREVTIDATSRVLQLGCADAAATRIEAGPAAVPEPGQTIGDRDVGRLLADAELLAQADVPVRSIGRDAWGGLRAVDVTGVTLRFGDDADLAQKAALIAPVRAGIGTRRVVRALDLRTPGTPIVEFR